MKKAVTKKHTSRVSSYPKTNLSWVAKLQIVPAITPNSTAAAVQDDRNVRLHSIVYAYGLTGADKTRTRGNSHQTGDSTTTETDSGPFSFDPVILEFHALGQEWDINIYMRITYPEHPSQSTDTSGQVRDDACHGGTKISYKGRISHFSAVIVHVKDTHR